MAQKLQYITNENGEQVGVLLDMAEYRRLLGTTTVDEDLLPGLNQAELHALAGSKLAPAAQNRLNVLLADNAAGQLSDEENVELDQLLAQIDQLTVLKTRATYTLDQQKRISTVA
jgi:hypothetical protein